MIANLTITLLSPMSHGAFGAPTGNAMPFRRMPTVDGRHEPVLSGNALRGVMRRTVFRDLLDRLGLQAGTAGFDGLYAALANGGHLEGSESGLDPEHVRKLRDALPPLSVFGAALGTWMLAGRMSVGISRPTDPSNPDLVQDWSHTRHVDRDEQDPTVSGVTPMPTTIETLVTGTTLRCEIVFHRRTTEIERACIGWALGQITHLGGKSTAGLGRVSIEHDIDAAPYLTWLSGLGDTQRQALNGLMEKLSARPKKEKKGAKTPSHSETA